MRYLPMFHDISDRPCLVVGAGPVALRKIMMLRRAKARVTVVAPRAIDGVRDLLNSGAIELRARNFVTADVAGHILVIAATGNQAVDEAVSKAARAAGISVNVVDGPDLSDFIMPAIVDRDPVIVAISSAGTAPMLARRIRAAIEAMLPAGLGKIAARAASLRTTVRNRIDNPRARRHFWENYFQGWRRCRVADNMDVTRDATAPTGGVSLVGAGPGDAELLTLRALQRLQDADIIIHDRLVGDDILDYARRDAEVINVGKTPGKHRYSQAEINALLAHHAGMGKQVVRLKGGDPLIFGRGGEERDYLLARGIAVEIVPGIIGTLSGLDELMAAHAIRALALLTIGTVADDAKSNAAIAATPPLAAVS
jgi:uroporphyrin-III C-methyltransferase/precorrin-2 dehydrogenase/sirohydrochlorin ferrochelatase